MKKITITPKSILFLLALIVLTGCERELSDDAVLATFPKTGEIFTDTFVSMGSDFYFPFADAKPDVFSVDNGAGYESEASIRIDVPNANDPTGSYAGAIFRTDAGPRDLSNFDALTFWARASQGVTIGEFGFGLDFEGDLYRAARSNVSLSTNWQKITIPIPDASKLTQEKGMFWFAAGTQDTGGNGYSFWVDEIQFETLGTTRLESPFIFNGQDLSRDVFVGESIPFENVGAIFNLASGQNVSVNAAPAYFELSSSDSNVTGPFTINALGQTVAPVISSNGTAVLTAQLANIQANGSFTVNAVGAFPHAPVPNRPAANVVSLFSDAYVNVPVRHYNGFFAPFQTTQGGAGSDPNNVDIQAPFANGDLDNIINYSSFNFVSIGMYDTVAFADVSSATHLHVDINVRETVDPGDFIRLSLESGTGGTMSSGDFTLTSTMLNNVDANGWFSMDIPLTSFPGFNDPANLGQVFFISDNTISDIWVDNVYFYN